MIYAVHITSYDFPSNDRCDYVYTFSSMKRADECRRYYDGRTDEMTFGDESMEFIETVNYVIHDVVECDDYEYARDLFHEPYEYGTVLPVDEYEFITP